MKRRKVIGALAAGGALGGGVWVAKSGSKTTSAGGDSGSDENAMASQEIETLDAPGSSKGTMTVPVPGEVTVLDAFATWCLPCKEQMTELNAAYEAVGDRARFVSVSNEAIGDQFTREDVVAWWREHDGNWPVGLEKQGNVTRELRINGIPYMAVIDSNGGIRWTHQGVTKGSKIVEQVEAILE